ncbi:hypothetical protein [Halostella salina]|uniref:hypothetical protein n=1 Tax=Halostella salina TaxID=1547897 RepID=UPI000EF833F0|nr:hypothetical protein [Halostella salina]
MQPLINALHDLTEQAEETADERADRLSRVGERADVDPVRLMDVEDDVRGLARLAADRNAETVAEAEAKLPMIAPMLGIDPEVAEDLGAETAVALLGRYAVEHPEITAKTVRTLHESMERAGLYEDLGTETPAPGELRETLTVE